MSNLRPIDTSSNIALMERLDAEIKRLRASRDFDKPLTEPTCAKDTPPGLVKRTFRYRDGRLCVVRCHAQVMVGLMRAMKDAPTIEVTASSDSAFSGSYRSWAQQNELYQAFKAGTGHQAANPCDGYHRRGRAVDILAASDREKKALLAVRVEGEQFFNGTSFGDPPHYSFGAKG